MSGVFEIGEWSVDDGTETELGPGQRCKWSKLSDVEPSLKALDFIVRSGEPALGRYDKV